MKKRQNIINWILTGVVGLIFIGSAMGKFFAGEEALQAASSIGLNSESLRILGIIELISVVLFVYPRTGVIGTLLLAAYMGGAIATHLTHGQSVIVLILIEAMIWVVAVLRFPELKARLLQREIR